MSETTPTRTTGKDIFIFCDGTGNKFIDKLDPKHPGSNSNVVKLYAALQFDRRHVAYYHPGVGTADDPAAKHWLSRKLSVLKGLAFAWGFKDNVLDAYQFLMDNYEDGDRVFMFGFSRGSYTVRALGGLLDGYGLLRRGNEGHLPYAWNEYVDQHNVRTRHHIEPNERFKLTFSQPGFRIHFMGIWDTVSSVGWIRTPLRLFSVAHNSIIDIGRHAISIDERRCFYRDNLWTGADQSNLVKHPEHEKQSGPKQDLLQVWFPGVHSDIGGSYPQHESVLSNSTLDWMLTEAANAGAPVSSPLHQMVLGEHVPQGDDAFLNHKITILRGLFTKPTEPLVHNSLRGLWWLLEVLPHRYYDKDDGTDNWRTPLGMWRRIPSGSYIHHSARHRMEHHLDYRPKSLPEGPDALQLYHVEGQKPDSIYLYRPQNDAQPVMNTTAVRIGVMVLVTALDLAAVALIPFLAWRLCRR